MIRIHKEVIPILSGMPIDIKRTIVSGGYEPLLTNIFNFKLFICQTAAGNGHLDVLKWARINNYLWDTSTCYHAAKK